METAKHTILFHEQENHKLYDQAMTSNYRKYDEVFPTTNSYKHIAGIITHLSSGFEHPIAVLDVGCGTGRYFHCLKNLKELTGIDVSHNMLIEARQPYKRSLIPLETISLIEGNFYTHDFGNEKFDFIYSVGVLGEHALFDKAVADKLFSLLKDGGKIFFTVVDIEPRKNLKRKAAEALYPILPKNVRNVLDQRWETLYMTYTQLDDIMKQTSFSKYTILRHLSEDPKWKGAHLECIAEK
jgi:ubiquinone/menaquinone biosynthesis C-methylase UbiE